LASILNWNYVSHLNPNQVLQHILRGAWASDDYHRAHGREFVLYNDACKEIERRVETAVAGNGDVTSPAEVSQFFGHTEPVMALATDPYRVRRPLVSRDSDVVLTISIRVDTRSRHGIETHVSPAK
jgi:hypothetical protein